MSVKYKIRNLSDRPIVFCGLRPLHIPARSECPEKVYEFSDAQVQTLLPRLRRYHSLQITQVKDEEPAAAANTATAAKSTATTAKTEKQTTATTPQTTAKATEKTATAKESK